MSKKKEEPEEKPPRWKVFFTRDEWYDYETYLRAKRAEAEKKKPKEEPEEEEVEEEEEGFTLG